jgi:hypothetical protein
MYLSQEISKFDFERNSIQEFEDFLSKSILGHTRPTFNLSNQSLFRARIINDIKEEDLETTCCIWYPDWSTISESDHKLNRCSDRGQNFFYSSNYLEATIKELSPKNGDLILVGIFSIRYQNIKIPCQVAGIEALKNTSQISLLKDYRYQSERDKEIEEFISKKFKQQVLEKNFNEYKLTIAVSNILLKNDNIGCLIYPSVASNYELVNFGMKPEFVDRLMICKTLYIYKVEKTEQEYRLIPEKYAAKVLRDRTLSKNSTIYWKENKEEDKNQILKYSCNMA